MYWISLEPTENDSQTIEALRDKLYTRVDDSMYDIEPNPHLTIIPGFTVDGSERPTADEFESHLPITIQFEVYHIWPEMETPMVVAIDPAETSELAVLQEDALEYVEEIGELKYDPTPFHLTLFKGGNAGDEADFSAPNTSKECIKVFVEDAEGLPISVTFDSVSVYEWEE